MSVGVEHHAMLMGIVGFHAKVSASNPAASAASVPPVYKPQINPLLTGAIALRRAVTRESRQARRAASSSEEANQTFSSRATAGYNLKTAPPSVCRLLSWH